MAGSNSALRPRLWLFLPRAFGLILGTMPRLKIALRLPADFAAAKNPQPVVGIDDLPTRRG
jgi:hypothetical protein